MMRVDGGCRYTPFKTRRRACNSPIVCISHDILPPLLPLPKVNGVAKERCPVLISNVEGGKKGRKMCVCTRQGHVSVVCARLLAVRCAVGRAEKINKIKIGKKIVGVVARSVIIWRHIWTGRRRTRVLCILFHNWISQSLYMQFTIYMERTYITRRKPIEFKRSGKRQIATHTFSIIKKEEKKKNKYQNHVHIHALEIGILDRRPFFLWRGLRPPL